MFKTDKKSLEKLSFDFDEGDLAHFKSIVKYLESNKLLTIPQKESKRILNGLNKIGKLKLDGKIYAFHVEDSYAKLNSSGEGVELYLRQGDALRDFFTPGDRDHVFSVDQASKFLYKNKISKIYTGNINFDSNFLGLYRESDLDDPIIRTILQPDDIQEFKFNKIDVVKLDSLI